MGILAKVLIRTKHHICVFQVVNNLAVIANNPPRSEGFIRNTPGMIQKGMINTDNWITYLPDHFGKLAINLNVALFNLVRNWKLPITYCVSNCSFAIYNPFFKCIETPTRQFGTGPTNCINRNFVTCELLIKTGVNCNLWFKKITIECHNQLKQHSILQQLLPPICTSCCYTLVKWLLI